LINKKQTNFLNGKYIKLISFTFETF